MKSFIAYICQQCGYKSPSFLGKCPNCNSWNSLVETAEKNQRISSWGKNKRERINANKAVKLSLIKTDKVDRITTGVKEVDQVLGGGLVPGSLILLAGDPGIGKSTLTLQVVSNVGGLYVSGEESSEQVKLRSERLGITSDKVLLLPETNIETIIEQVGGHQKDLKLIIIDSIQTLWTDDLSGAPGSIGQVRECTLKLLEIAKREHLSIILVGHITKEGTIAGPKTLEHIVDTVLYLEGDRFQSLRLLRTSKNRFGPVDEVGVFSMEEKGMIEVENPSELFLGQRKNSAGSAVIVTLEGTRPLLVEVQALTIASNMPLPRRIGNGINNNRLQMLVAVIQKHLKLPLGNYDIFVNIASGLKILEPAADLGICLAVISSFKNKPIPSKTAVIGEVGLLGEVRMVIGLERRIKEAKKLGFVNTVSPKNYSNISTAEKEIYS